MLTRGFYGNGPQAVAAAAAAAAVGSILQPIMNKSISINWRHITRCDWHLDPLAVANCFWLACRIFEG